MKKIIPIYPFLFIAMCLTIYACQKSVSSVRQPSGQPSSDSAQALPDSTPQLLKPDTLLIQTSPYPQAPSTGCSYAPNYGDSIIYPQPVSDQDYIVQPINNPGAGKYLSWPIGLAIDSVTGKIDVTKSETGMRYAIGFVKSGTTDTCLNTLIIGGADYMDSVYVLSDGATTAVPYYEANPYLPSVCSGNGCTFDVTGSAANQKVIVNTSNGVIDLVKTLNGTGLLGGAFGLLPLNGQTITTTIYYRLNDASNNALQHIDVRLAYYASKSQIGPAILGSLVSKLDNILEGNLISTTSNPRPPLVIIVRSK